MGDDVPRWLRIARAFGTKETKEAPPDPVWADERDERSPAPLPPERLVLHLAAELGWPKVVTISGQPVGPGEADWRRVVESPKLLEPIKGLLLAGLRAALVRRRDGVPLGESWYEYTNRPVGGEGEGGWCGEWAPGAA